MKDKFNIGFFGKDSHAGCLIEMFQDALPNHPNVESVDWETTFTRFGKEALPMRGEEYLLENIKKYDLIFLQSGQISPEIEKLFDDFRLWGHTVVCDFYDEQRYETKWLDKCLLYMKRSWDNRFIPKGFNNIIPISPSIMSFYPDIAPSGIYGIRDLPITCTLLQANRGRGYPRDTVADAVKNADWKLSNGTTANLTLFYSCGSVVSMAATLYRLDLTPPAPRVNWWYIYMHVLRRTKILFTAIHSEDGDIGENIQADRGKSSFSRYPKTGDGRRDADHETGWLR